MYTNKEHIKEAFKDLRDRIDVVKDLIAITDDKNKLNKLKNKLDGYYLIADELILAWRELHANN